MRIIYVDIDSLTPSHLSCYGYPRKTSPAIDALAAEGVRFTNVYCSDAPCLPSRTAFYSGRFGFQTGVVGHGGTAAQPRIEGPSRGFRDILDATGLASRLQSRGLHTVFVSPFGQRHSAHWIYGGFNEVHNTGKCGLERADEVAPVVEDWLSRNGSAKKSWFLHVNFWDPHTPYRTPLEYGNPFAGQPLPPWITPELLARHIARAGPHSAQDLGLYCGAANPKHPRVPDAIVDETTLRQWIDGYDIGIRYMDDFLGRLVAQLRSLALYDDTAIIVSADHGENQGELGLYGEHATADVGTCNVPLIIKWPGARRGAVDEQLHYQLDLAPTLADLLQIESPPLWDGQSFASTIVEGSAAKKKASTKPRDELILGQCAHVCQRSVRFDRWLYMRTYHDGFQPFPPEMLFDLANDLHEQTDVATANKEICRDGASRLSRWHVAQTERLARNAGPAAVDPMQTVLSEGGPYHACHTPAASPLPEYCRHLERTGRSQAADDLRRRYSVG